MGKGDGRRRAREQKPIREIDKHTTNKEKRDIKEKKKREKREKKKSKKDCDLNVRPL